MGKKKILILTNIPSPYMVNYLNELGKYCNLTAIFERGKASVRDNSWKEWKPENFKAIILKGLEFGKPLSDRVSTIKKKKGKNRISIGISQGDMAFSPQIIKYIDSSYDRIIVGNPCTPTGIFACYYMNFRKISYGFQSEGGFPGPGRGIKEYIKRSIFSKGKFYFSTADIGDEYYIKYGAKKEQIRRYPFSSIYETDILAKPLSINEKRTIRNKLGIKYEKVIISVGRLIPNKGYDIFISAFKNFPNDVGIFIIGGTPTEDYIRMRDKANSNIHFVSFLRKEQLIEYYKMADVFAINTRLETWGLFVNESMAFGIPVVTTNQCYAALAMIEQGKEGFIVEVDDGVALANKVQLLLNNENLRAEMSINCLKKARSYTIESEAKSILNQL